MWWILSFVFLQNKCAQIPMDLMANLHLPGGEKIGPKKGNAIESY